MRTKIYFRVFLKDQKYLKMLVFSPMGTNVWVHNYEIFGVCLHNPIGKNVEKP
jgi:hypothetical protein